MDALPQRWTIRWQLLALVLAAFLPVAGVVAYVIVDSAHQSLESSVGSVGSLAAQAADRLHNLISDREALLGRFAERPLVRALDPQRCDPLFSDYVRLHPEYNTLGLRDRNGNIVCSFIPNPPRSADVVGSAWFQSGLRSGRFTASDAHLGQPSGQWVTVLTHPIRDDAGEITGIAVLAVNLMRLQARVLGAVPQGAVVSVVDRNNRVLLRSDAPEKWIGKPVANPILVDRARLEGTGVLSVTGIDGIARVYAYRTMPSTGWLVFAGMPDEQVYGTHRQRLRNSLLLGFAALALVLLLALAVARSIARPLRELKRTASAAGAGDRMMRASERGNVEVAAVAQEFNRMLDARAQAERDAQAGYERFRRVFRTAPVPMVLTDIASSRFVDVNDAFCTLFGFSRDEAIGRTSIELELWVDPADRARNRERILADRKVREFEVQQRTRTGGILDILINGDVIDWAGEPSILTVLTDITHLRQAEREKAAAHVRFERIFHSAPIAAAITAVKDGRIVDANATYCALAGRPREALIGATARQLRLWVDPREREAFIANLHTHGRVAGEVVRVRNASGEVRRMLVSAELIEFLGERCMVSMGFDITERERAEEALRASELRYRLAASTGEIWDWDIGTNTLSAQQRFWERLGFPEVAAGGQVQLFEAQIHADDLERWRQAVRNHVTHRTPYDLEFRMRARSGEYRWFHTHGQAVWGDNGHATYMAGTTFDITERKRAEEALREQDERLRIAVGAASLHQWEWRIAEDRLAWDRDPVSLLGEARGGNYPDFCELVHPEDRERFLATGRAALEQDLPYDIEFRIVRSDGDVRWLAATGSVIRDAQGAPQRMLGVTRDVSARKRAETERIAASQRFESIFLGAPEAMSIGDLASGRLLMVNDAFCETFGRAREELIGRTSLELGLWTDPSRREAIVAELRAGRTVRGVDGQTRRRSGEVRQVIYSGEAIEFGNETCLLLMFTDVTERRQAEALVRESEAKLRKLLDGLGPEMFVGLLTPEGTIMEANQPALAAAGLTIEDVLGKPVEQTPWFSWSAPVQRQLRAAVERAAGGEATRFDIQIRATEERFIWLDFSMQPLLDESGRVACLVPSAMVIDARKRAEQRTQESEERLRLALDAAHMGTYDWDIARNAITWSKWHEELWAYVPGEFDGSYEGFARRVHPDDLAGLNDEIQRCLAAREPYAREFRIVWPDGSIHWIAGSGRFEYDAGGQPVRMRGVVLEITRRKLQEQALREAEERLRSTTAMADIAVWEYDFEVGHMTRSANHDRLYGLPWQDPWTIDTFLAATHPDDREFSDRIIQAATAPGGVDDYAFDFRVIWPDGGVHWLWVSGRVVQRSATGQGLRVRGVLVDVTERKRTQEALREANRRLQIVSARLLEVQEAERAAIARELHDEIGQSLTALKLGAQGLARQVKDDSAKRVATLVEIADRALTQTRSLSLDLRPPQLDHLGLAATLRDTLERVATPVGIETHLVSEPENLQIDRGLAIAAFRIAQEALTNSVRHAAPKRIVVELFATRDVLEVAVIDDGRGFDPEAARARAIKGGSVGLLGMEERATLAGGELRIVTRPGEGTRIEATFPLRFLNRHLEAADAPGRI